MHNSEKTMLGYFNRPGTFFALSTIGPWAAWLVAAWFSRLETPSNLSLFLVSLFAGIGLLLPVAVAWVLIRPNPVLRQDFGRRLSFKATTLRHVLLGVGIMLASILLAQGISLGFGYSLSQFQFANSASFTAGILVGWIPLLLAPIIEEIGWHGYGTDALRRSMNLFWTSLVFSVYWALWHLPLAFIEGYYQANLVETGPLHTVNFLASLIPFVLLMNWLYYRSGRSIWVAVAFHLAANVFNESFQTHPDSKVIQTGLLLVLTLVVILRDPAFFFGHDRSIRNHAMKAAA